MAEAATPPEPRDSLSPDELADAWNRFRAGEIAVCPRDGAPLALAVDGSAGSYRFVCPGCPLASPWFESDAGGIRIGTHAHAPPRDHGED